MSESLESTLGNRIWVKDHESELRALFPDTWTNIHNLNGLQIGFKLKLLGIDWRSKEEFARVMIWFERIGILQRENGYLVRANHLSIFQ